MSNASNFLIKNNLFALIVWRSLTGLCNNFILDSFLNCLHHFFLVRQRQQSFDSTVVFICGKPSTTERWIIELLYRDNVTDVD